MKTEKEVGIELVEVANEKYFKISNVDLIRPFFMSVVSDWNHWMFISSNGGLTAGRKNAEYALFPYYTDDKITESAEHTGSKTIIRVKRNIEVYLWEPFSVRSAGKYQIVRNLYKSKYGNKLLFEEINADLNLTFRYEWCSSRKYGFVRHSSLINKSDETLNISVLDGLQNVLPASVPSDLQVRSSNLVDAYKRTELQNETGLAIFALSAIIVDRAEPSEALKANVAWSFGLDVQTYLLSKKQLNDFREGHNLSNETDIKGEKACYFICSELSLAPEASKAWSIVAELNLNHSKVFGLIENIRKDEGLPAKVLADIKEGTRQLIMLNASADGIQLSSDKLRDARHFTNVLFNNMRGGIFDNGYNMLKSDFIAYLEHANLGVLRANKEIIEKLPVTFSLHQLNSVLDSTTDRDFKRLAIEYLPIKFSRRHGDPSRPWNRFSINMIDERDGTKVLDYEGNWRDIFQNWEAMVHAFPDFIDGMIFRFLNASTFDGYNPYRITKGGFDWESIEPDDPWSYIGYWGDHQIIYLLKFLEFINDHQPGKLARYFSEDLFVYANVPYRIKSYKEIVENPKDTILFNEDGDHSIRNAMEREGADASLLRDRKGNIYHVNFIEKMLAMVLAKMSNFVPGAGIWMNTQRPEWNDANNALVGNGVSMVTLYYLRRFFVFFHNVLKDSKEQETLISEELFNYFQVVFDCFKANKDIIGEELTDQKRKGIVDEIGIAASEYRNIIYDNAFSAAKHTLDHNELLGFVNLCVELLDDSIASNKRSDGLFHSYNLISFDDDKLTIDHLSEMLEGQVAVLSSGYLDAASSLALLDSLKNSALFRHDQYSYLLYPNKQLPGFLERNLVPRELLAQSKLVKALLERDDNSIIEKDVLGQFHFNSDFRNAEDLSHALHKIKGDELSSLAQEEEEMLLDVFESVFNHKSFTGRSGTFYGYEGLGSIYWHMVSKLLLAVQETSKAAVSDEADPSLVGRILEHFYEINEGIGVHKSPSLYGAFPTDPYSHTPAQKGAQQPGMTGQVKEDVLSRFGELGVFVQEGQLYFYPCLLRSNEFLIRNQEFKYFDVENIERSISIGQGSLAFTYCQVPVVYSISDSESITLKLSDGDSQVIKGHALSVEMSKQVFRRTGQVLSIHVDVDKKILK